MLIKVRSYLRAIKKNKAALATNIVGLSIGLAATILLVVFILHEWSYDRHFSKASNIYRLHSIWIENGEPSVEPINVREAFSDIPREVPGIDKAVQIYRGFDVVVNYANTNYGGNNLLYADSTFFNIFDFKVVEGELSNSLKNPNSVVITEKTAKKLFGSEAAVGKGVAIENKMYTVSAVTENVPVNTHFSFDLLLPMRSLSYLSLMQGLEFFTYYLYKPNADVKKVSDAIIASNTNILKEGFSSFNSEFSSEVIPLKRLHLHANTSYGLGPQGSINTVILVAIISFLIMFLALSNFVNLFIIEGEQRAKEIGVRKVNGATITEVMTMLNRDFVKWVAIAFVIATPIAWYSMHKWLENFACKTNLSWWIFALAGVLALGIALLTVSWQSWRAATRNPVEALRYE